MAGLLGAEYARETGAVRACEDQSAWVAEVTPGEVRLDREVKKRQRVTRIRGRKLEFLVLGALAIILYTSIGGFLAVSWTDLVQALLMAAALLLVVGGYGYSDHMGMIMMPEVAADEIEAGRGQALHSNHVWEAGLA